MTATFSSNDPTLSRVEAIDPDEIPTDGNRVQVQSVTRAPDQFRAGFASRQTESDIIEPIRQRIGTVCSRV